MQGRKHEGLSWLISQSHSKFSQKTGLDPQIIKYIYLASLWTKYGNAKQHAWPPLLRQRQRQVLSTCSCVPPACAPPHLQGIPAGQAYLPIW